MQHTTDINDATQHPHDITQLLQAAAPPLPKIGEMAEGTVVARGTASLFVDLGPKGTGIIYGKEFYAAQDALRKLNIGDRIVAKVIDNENEEGYIELSVAEAGRELSWSHIKELHRNGETLSVTIKSANRGGLVAEVESVSAFLPASQLGSEHYPHVEGGDKEKILEELKKLIGKELRVKILDVNPKEEKVILSERARELEELQEELNQFHVGDMVEGTVSRMAEFGLFVKFGPDEKLEGLVHSSEIDWTPTPNFQELFKVGDKCKVKIIDIEGGRVSLSLKALKPDPWEAIAKQFPKGSKIEAPVTRIATFGAFVDVAPGVQGLVHLAEYGSEQALRAEIEEGKTYAFRVADIDAEARRMSLKPWREHEELGDMKGNEGELGEKGELREIMGEKENKGEAKLQTEEKPGEESQK